MYSSPLYRPPSEARSLIIQLTEGCSYNKCTFCGMYKTKPFRIRTEQEIIDHLNYLKSYDPNPSKIFIADGNFLCLSTDKILHYLDKVKASFPNATRISCYGGPLDLNRKTPEELLTIRQSGMDMLYLGVESGSDEVLKLINKGVTAHEMTIAGQKAMAAGFILSCMIISGIGGKPLSEKHALESAKVISAIDPQFMALLTLHVEDNTPLKDDILEGKFESLTPDEIMVETYQMIKHLQLTHCTFRSNHVSNYVNLKGVLNQDKDTVLKQIESAMKSKDYTPEYFRRI